MVKYLYTNITGTSLHDEKGKLLKKSKVEPSYENLDRLAKGELLNEELNLIKGEEVLSLTPKNDEGIKNADLNDPSMQELYEKVASKDDNKDFFSKSRDAALDYTAEMLRRHSPYDSMIIQSISTIDDLDRTINTFSTRLREWFSLYNPELAEEVHDHKKYAEKSLELSRAEDSIGTKISKKDLEPIKRLAELVLDVYKRKEEHEKYLEALLQDRCPNMSAVATPMIAARLISFAGSMSRLINFPSSTIQTLGAEKAMFRHLKSGGKPPKYGIIVLHPIVAKARYDDKGKIARALGSKILIAAKIDYFGGEGHQGLAMLDELEKRFGDAS